MVTRNHCSVSSEVRAEGFGKPMCWHEKVIWALLVLGLWIRSGPMAEAGN